jgi:peroxiredoxin
MPKVHAMWKLLVVLLITACSYAENAHPTLAIGSPAPDFVLPGTDGDIHRLSDYAKSQVLVVVFTCNHCPIAQMYEDRISQLSADYRGKNVAVVAIQPNSPNAIRIDELDSSDMSDTLDEMKVRMTYRHLNYPYLYDGETQSVAEKYGPKATPHVFVFDGERKLRYEGRMDNSYRKELVKTQDARNAIDAILGGQPVAVTHTGVFGCSTKWKSKEASRIETLKKIEAEPVALEMAGDAELKKLRANPTGKLLLVSFWATWCGPCVHEMADLQDTYRMYRVRDFDLITVSANMPDEKHSVLEMLQKKHASTRNLLFASDDTQALQAAFNPQWQSAVPYTALISADGKIVYEKNGDLDMVTLRRIILANMPGDYVGFQNYWKVQ